ncbi:MAG: universal stress protein [Proteobacteria bacterium]|nr:universal stress protein [Pseudomonadota bacterium]
MERFATSLLGEAKTLLLATDGSNFSDGAAQEAIFFGQACGAKVIALHVVKIDAESLKSAESAVRIRRQELEPYMDHFREMAKDTGVEVEFVIIGASHPEEAIIDQATLRNADVILMGRHGKAGRLSLLIGRMTSRVLDLGFPRVLVVPKDFIIAGARVLLATDDSPGALKAVEEAMSLGHRSSTLQRLTIMSVVKRDTNILDMQQVVEALCFRVSQAGPQVLCEPLVQVGDPSELIIRAAQERETDMILIGGRGKRGMTRMLLGHVTRNVTGKAHCAVLVVNT